jgi:hypothetical protein
VKHLSLFSWPRTHNRNADGELDEVDPLVNQEMAAMLSDAHHIMGWVVAAKSEAKSANITMAANSNSLLFRVPTMLSSVINFCCSWAGNG